MGALGETIDTPHRYHTHPAAPGWLYDGAPLDAGSTMELDNNVSVVGIESLRHLCSEHIGVTSVNYAGGSGFDPYQNVWDVTEPTSPDEFGSVPPPAWQAIPWTDRDSRRSAPFAMFADRDLTDFQGGVGFRSIKVRVVLADIVTPFRMFFALTDPNDTPWNGRSYAWDAQTSIAAATTEVTSILRPTITPTSRALRRPLRRCRAAGGNGGTISAVAMATLWIGWHAGAAGQKVICVSAFEVRE